MDYTILENLSRFIGIINRAKQFLVLAG